MGQGVTMSQLAVNDEPCREARSAELRAKHRLFLNTH